MYNPNTRIVIFMRRLVCNTTTACTVTKSFLLIEIAYESYDSSGIFFRKNSTFSDGELHNSSAGRLFVGSVPGGGRWSLISDLSM